MQEEKSSYLSAEWDHWRAGTWCNSTISVNGAALWAWPCKEGSPTGTVHKQLSKNPRSTEKARNSSYCLCYASLTLVKWSKTLCPQLLRLTPPDPPSSGISSGSDESNHPLQVSRAPSRFPDCFLLPADYNSRFGTPDSSVNYSRTHPQTLVLLSYCQPFKSSQEEVPVQWEHCRGVGMPQQWKARQLSSLPVNTGEGKDNLPGVMS